MKIDLKVKPETEKMPEVCDPMNKPYYPCVYISNNPKISEIPEEGTAIITYKKVSETESNRNGKHSYSCDIEIMTFEPTGKAKSKPQKPVEQSVDENMNEAEEEDEDY